MINHSNFSIKNITDQLEALQDLGESDVISIGHALIDESFPAEDKRNLLVAWQKKGEKAQEVASLAKFFQSHATNPGLQDFSSNAIDIVGTGGDKSGTFNISTTTAIVVAAGGVPVIKHGNRSITSKTGSADLLESLGISFTSDSDLLKQSLQHNNFVFLFAPAFHPAFKSIMPVRKALAAEGKKTVFNILGPLINPAKPAHQLMGVFGQKWVDPLAQTLTTVGIHRGVVVHSDYQGQSMDEITSIGNNSISPAGEISASDVHSIQSLIAKHTSGKLEDLKGGQSEENLQIFDSILNFEANNTLLNTICINAGVAFFLAKNTQTVEEGFDKAQDLLKSGKVRDWTNNTRKFFRNEA